MVWYPHVTVAAIVPKDGQFLMVAERNETGQLVYNQPAGHLEPNESLAQALVREAFEETGWYVRPTAVINFCLYRAPANNTTYLRVNFLAEAIKHDETAVLDPDIEQALWLDENDILSRKDYLRSELVWSAIEHFNRGEFHPLSILQTSPTIFPDDQNNCP